MVRVQLIQTIRRQHPVTFDFELIDVPVITGELADGIDPQTIARRLMRDTLALKVVELDGQAPPARKATPAAPKTLTPAKV